MVAQEVGALEWIRLGAALDELLTHVDAGPGDPALVVCIRDFFRHATCDESIVEQILTHAASTTHCIQGDVMVGDDQAV